MARKKVYQPPEGTPAWLVTFSDLMTLLLTFFVLLLSMASMDSTILTRISSYSDNLMTIESGRSGKIPERIEMIIAALQDPDTVMEKLDRLKDMLFPHELLPPELPYGDLMQNLDILMHPEGVVIVLAEGILFAKDSADLDARGKKLIELLTPVILYSNSDVNISGFTDSTPSRRISNDDLSALRALSILEQFLQARVQADRFSISGYGADKPLYPNDTEANRRKNRRVEILLKTTPRLGGYIN